MGKRFPERDLQTKKYRKFSRKAEEKENSSKALSSKMKEEGGNSAEAAY